MQRTQFIVGAALALTFFVVGCSPSGEHFQDVKAAVFTGNETLNTSIELRLGVIPIWLAGQVVRFVDEPEAQEARDYLPHISSVDVGVYELQNSRVKRHRDILQEVKDRMLEHQFEPLVLVREKSECVGIFTPVVEDKLPWELFIVVLEGKEVILVRVRGNFEKLARAALQNHPLDIPHFNKAIKEEWVL